MKEGIARQSGRTDRIEPRGSDGAAGLEHGPRPPHKDRNWMVQSGSPERGRADEPNRVGIRPEAKIQSPTRAAGQVSRPDSPRRAGAVARQSYGNGLYGFGQKADEPWIWLAMDAKSSQVTTFHLGARRRKRATRPGEDAFGRSRGDLDTDPSVMDGGAMPAARDQAMSPLARKPTPSGVLTTPYGSGCHGCGACNRILRQETRQSSRRDQLFEWPRQPHPRRSVPWISLPRPPGSSERQWPHREMAALTVTRTRSATTPSSAG